MDLLLFDGHSFELQCLGNCNAVCIKNKNFLWMVGWSAFTYPNSLTHTSHIRGGGRSV